MEAPALDFAKQSYHDSRSVLKKSAAHAMGLLREFDYGYELIPAKMPPKSGCIVFFALMQLMPKR